MKRILIYAVTFLAMGLITISCNDANKEKVSSFAENFAQYVKANNRDSICIYYPGAEWADNIEVVYNPDSLSIKKMDKDGEYRVAYRNGAEMTVVINPDGTIRIKESNGLFKYSENKLSFARKVGAMKDGMNDEELAKVMTNVENLSTELYNDYVNTRKNGIKDLGFTVTKDIQFMMDLGEGYHTLKNITDQPIGAEDYEITWNVRYMGSGVDTSSTEIKKGTQDIPPHESIRIQDNFTGHGWREIKAITVHTPSKDDFYKNYVPKGDEYLTYVKVNGDTPVKRKSLGYGPFLLAGKIDDKYPIHLTLDKGMKTGSYYYDKNGSKATLNLTVKEYNENTGEITIEEKNDKGEVTGTFIGVLSAESFVGNMTSYQGKSFTCNLKVEE